MRESLEHLDKPGHWLLLVPSFGGGWFVLSSSVEATREDNRFPMRLADRMLQKCYIERDLAESAPAGAFKLSSDGIAQLDRYRGRAVSR